jgi:hypothetical protein
MTTLGLCLKTFIVINLSLEYTIDIFGTATATLAGVLSTTRCPCKVGYKGFKQKFSLTIPPGPMLKNIYCSNLKPDIL